MMAITIWQPWATLIVAGAKPYEFRGWPAPRAIRGKRIAIHAGARKPRIAEIEDLIARLRSADAWSTALRRDAALPLLERWRGNPVSLPLSCVIGTALLGEPINAAKIIHEFGGPVNDSDRFEHCNWAWPLTEIEPSESMPARGRQGFWEWSGS